MARVQLLKKIIEIQNITLREKKRGMPQTWIFENIIQDQYFISKPTYDRYLARNAKKELSAIEKELPEANINSPNAINDRTTPQRRLF